MATTVHDEQPGEFENRHFERGHSNKEAHIEQEVMYGLNETVMNPIFNMIEKLLHNMM